MFTEDESKALFTRVFDLMVKARWIHHYTFTDGKGFRPAWTTLGCKRATQFNSIIEACGLDKDDRGAPVFDLLAHGKSLPEGVQFIGTLPKDMARDWINGVAELGLHGDGDGLLAMVHIIDGWKPGLDTPLEFGPPE